MIRAFQNNIPLSFEWRLQRFEVVDDKGKSVAPVMDVLFDDDGKSARYVMIDIGGGVGVSGKRVLLPADMVRRAGFGTLVCDASEEEMFCAPILENTENPAREDEQKIFDHFKMDPYWRDEATQKEEARAEGVPQNIGSEGKNGK